MWTRGRLFLLSDLANRLKCPACGSRRVRLLYDVPNEPKRAGRSRHEQTPFNPHWSLLQLRVGPFGVRLSYHR